MPARDTYSKAPLKDKFKEPIGLPLRRGRQIGIHIMAGNFERAHEVLRTAEREIREAKTAKAIDKLTGEVLQYSLAITAHETPLIYFLGQHSSCFVKSGGAEKTAEILQAKEIVTVGDAVACLPLLETGKLRLREIGRETIASIKSAILASEFAGLLTIE